MNEAKRQLLSEVMAELGRKGAAARTKSLSAKERSDIARKAVRAKWKNWRKKRRQGKKGQA